MLAETLKISTSEAHRHAESRELQRLLLKGQLDSGRFAQFLAQLHGVHALLERLFDTHVEPAMHIGWCDQHRHSIRLERDLESLGISINMIESAPVTQEAFDVIEKSVQAQPLSLLGFFYVLEGSMNGNRYIVRALSRSPLAATCGFAYFDPYAESQPAIWGAFKVALNQVNPDAAQQQAIVDAALVMFKAIADISDEVVSATVRQQVVEAV